MNEFIAALKKRSSLNCITRERFGKVDLEFVTVGEAIDFSKQILRIISGDINWPELKPEDKQGWRQYYNMQELIKIFTDYEVPDPHKIAIVAVESDESPHIEWRSRLSWAFESGPKAADLFQRLSWLLE